MIDEKKLIEELKFQINNCETYGHSDIYIDLEMAKKWVETIEKKKVGEWIPVEERLPEPYKAVLLCYIGFNDKVAYSDGIALVDYSGNWIWAFDENCEDEIKNEVIAWMDLPKPYEVRE